MGPSGAGKSTLLLLILGMLEPAAGRIAIDGADPASYFDRAGERLGYVGAEPFLMDGSHSPFLSRPEELARLLHNTNV